MVSKIYYIVCPFDDNSLSDKNYHKNTNNIGLTFSKFAIPSYFGVETKAFEKNVGFVLCGHIATNCAYGL